MTSASELFHNRRARLGRNTTESSVDRILNHNHHIRRHQHHNNRRDRSDLDGCDPLRRSPHPRHPINRPSFPEREPDRLDQGGSQSALNAINSETFRDLHNGQRFNGNDRLPGAVVLARARLLERLRGVSVSGNRQSNRASSRIHHDDFTIGGNGRIIDPENWETEISRDWLAFTPSTDTDQLLALQETGKRPPGLTQEALDCLHIEVFCNEDNDDEEAILMVSRECSICLETFVERDELIRLSCGHRFHSCCLDPWVRTCGDCPYCRTGIVVTT